jgi:hypothetical protein
MVQEKQLQNKLQIELDQLNIQRIINVQLIFQKQKKAQCLERIFKQGKFKSQSAQLTFKQMEQQQENQKILIILESLIQETKTMDHFLPGIKTLQEMINP